MTFEQAVEVKDRVKRRLMALPSVYGVGISKSEDGTCFLNVLIPTTPSRDLSRQIYEIVDRVPFKTTVVGEMSLFSGE
jgi:hypothetical protein